MSVVQDVAWFISLLVGFSLFARLSYTRMIKRLHNFELLPLITQQPWRKIDAWTWKSPEWFCWMMKIKFSLFVVNAIDEKSDETEQQHEPLRLFLFSTLNMNGREQKTKAKSFLCSTINLFVKKRKMKNRAQLNESQLKPQSIPAQSCIEAPLMDFSTEHSSISVINYSVEPIAARECGAPGRF